jgi:ATP-dependent helicase/nuclease subunit A
VGDFEAEFDADESAREREETKRLMYVALTRARDRLYLASTTARGAFKPRKGSLGEVLPESLRGVFGAAAAVTGDGAEVLWTAGTGTSHAFRICASTAAPEPAEPAPFSAAHDGPESEWSAAADDFEAVDDRTGRERRPITSAGRAVRRWDSEQAPGSTDGSGVVVGRVVHRMFQAEVRGDLPGDDLAANARGLVTAEEAWMVKDLERAAADAALVFAGMWSQPALREVLDGAACYYEVPLSVLAEPGKEGGSSRVLRGVIDCLAWRPDGRVVVVDFKTGTRRESDRRQLRAYVDAVRSMYPGSSVEGCLVYPEAAS